MQLRYIGKDAGSQVKECPAPYTTGRGTYVVRGWSVDDPQERHVPGRAPGGLAR